MNLTTHLLELIKTAGLYEGEDVPISINELISLDHTIPPLEIITARVEGLDDIQTKDRGFIILRHHFE